MRVWDRAHTARLISRVIVATDDERIFDAVQSHGGEARMTSPNHQSGTDRIAEIARSLDFDIVVNVQGDEPLIDPSTIDAAVEPLLEDSAIQVSTTSEPITSIEDVLNPAVVKVITDARGFAIYFSRSPIPFVRTAPGLTLEETLKGDARLLACYRKHSGLYAYRSDFLQKFAAMQQSELERLESLEQLRAIENGYAIKVVKVEHRSTGVDTEQDYDKVKRLIEENL